MGAIPLPVTSTVASLAFLVQRFQCTRNIENSEFFTKLGLINNYVGTILGRPKLFKYQGEGHKLHKKLCS